MIALFFLLLNSSVYSMEHAYELVPLLHEKDACINKENLIASREYKQIKNSNPMLEKLFLVRSMPELLQAEKTEKADRIQNTIAEYMFQLDRNKRDRTIVLDYQKKISLQQKTIIALQKEIRESIHKKYHCSDEIRLDVNGCVDTCRASTAGACCGTMTGTMAMSAYGILEGYVWCCCGGSILPNKIMCQIWTWGFPSCACAGCVIGTGCVLTGLHKRIRCDL
jgi:hypothetical protein